MGIAGKGKAMMSQQDVEKREKALRMAIEKVLPDFSCKETDGPLLIHQDAFAADYNEYELLGMATSLGADVPQTYRPLSATRMHFEVGVLPKLIDVHKHS